jgi:putative ABC transport system ATP-binding protein
MASMISLKDITKTYHTELNQQGTTIAIVTHDANVAARTKRIIRMVDGVIIEQDE